MSEKSKIQWCDSTLNFWSGCTKVSDGCKNCYAETLSDRKLTDAKGNLTIGKWGKGAPRKLHESAFKMALRLNRKPWICDYCGHAHDDYHGGNMACHKCSRYGKHRRRIFSLSLGDWLDPEVPVEWLARMLDIIRQCPDVTWILCTKRPELCRERLKSALEYMQDHVGFLNVMDSLLVAWLDGTPPKNIIFLASVENQAMADKRIPELLRIPAACRGLSLEPLLGPVKLPPKAIGASSGLNDIHWLIIGGESGDKARPCNVEWIRSLVAQGLTAGVATFVKQLGHSPCTVNVYTPSDSREPEQVTSWLNLRDKKGGDLNEFPHDLQIREFPKL